MKTNKAKSWSMMNAISGILFYLFFLSFKSEVRAQTWSWAEQHDCVQLYSKFTATANGGFIVYGVFEDSLVLGSNILISDSNTFDMFIAKYDAGKNVLWAKSFGSNYPDGSFSIDQLNDLKEDVNANLIFTGSFGREFIYGQDTLHSIRDWQDGFIASCDSMGNPLWIKHFHGRAAEGGYAIFTDANANIYLAGAYVDYDVLDTLIFEEQHVVIDSVVLPFKGLIDNFLLRMNSQGKIDWVKSWGGKGNDQARKWVSDGAGNMYSVMFFDSTFFIGTDSTVSRGGKDSAVQKFDTSGNLIWNKHFGNVKDDIMNASVGRHGDLYVYGHLDSICTIENVDIFDTSASASFIAKLDSSGSYLYSKVFPSSALNNLVRDLTEDVNGDIYFVGEIHLGDLVLDTFRVVGRGQFNTRSYIAKADRYFNILKVLSPDDNGRTNISTIAYTPDGPMIGGNYDSIAIFGSDTLFADQQCNTHNFWAQIGFTVSINEISILPSLTLYPNPTSKNAELLISLTKKSDVRVLIYTIQGTKVYDVLNPILQVGENKILINLENKSLSPGIYICTVLTGSGSQSIKLVVQ